MPDNKLSIAGSGGKSAQLSDLNLNQPHLSRRLKFFASHLLISATLVGVVSAAVLFVWYPSPLFGLQGALIILVMVAFVDVVIGPLLTLVVSSPRKGQRELVRDLAIIGAVQLGALLYGAHSLFVARPAFLVFNADRFDVVVANELTMNSAFPYRDSRFSSAPLAGPTWAIAYPPDGLDERNRFVISSALGGPDTKDIPALYESWPPKRPIPATRLKPLNELMSTSNDGKEAGLRAMRISGLAEADLSYVPLVGREKIGVVILNRQTLAVVYASDATPTY